MGGLKDLDGGRADRNAWVHAHKVRCRQPGEEEELDQAAGEDRAGQGTCGLSGRVKDRDCGLGEMGTCGTASLEL